MGKNSLCDPSATTSIATIILPCALPFLHCPQQHLLPIANTSRATEPKQSLPQRLFHTHHFLHPRCDPLSSQPIFHLPLFRAAHFFPIAPGQSANSNLHTDDSTSALNILAVKAYGEAEFWLSGGKVILIFILFSFTFVTMVGGNPQGDAYGFRYWNTPGAFATYLSDGRLGRFEGFLACLWSAAFCIVGPEYISMVAAEAKRPRIYIKNAFKTVYWRFGLFFILGALCAGIVLPYNDRTLGEEQDAGTQSAAASPYVIAMTNLGIDVLPHIVNALMVTSIFSAGNTYTYCATRSLYGLALEGRAPKVLRYCTKNGVPLWCFCIVMCFPCLSFLQVSSASNQVLSWLVNLVTGGGIINYNVMCMTYIFFHRAVKAQGVDRQAFPYTGWFQPYGVSANHSTVAHGSSKTNVLSDLHCPRLDGIYHLVLRLLFLQALERREFLHLLHHAHSRYVSSLASLQILHMLTNLPTAVLTFTGWKLFKRTRLVRPHEADLVWERPNIDAYEETFYGPPVGFWREIVQVVGIGKIKGGNDPRRGSLST